MGRSRPPEMFRGCRLHGIAQRCRSSDEVAGGRRKVKLDRATHRRSERILSASGKGTSGNAGERSPPCKQETEAKARPRFTECSSRSCSIRALSKGR